MPRANVSIRNSWLLVLAVVLAVAIGACVHHPRRAELRTYDLREALDWSRQALLLRYAGVRMVEAPLGRLQSDDRYESDDPPTRTRAYVALTPGEFGWAAEVTVVREALSSGGFRVVGAPAGWVYTGRDSDMEKFLVVSLEEWLREPNPVFVDSAPASAASAPAR